MIDFKLKKNLGPLEQLPEKLRKLAPPVVTKTTFLIEGDSKLQCPVQFGVLRASIYSVTFKGTDYTSSNSQARQIWSSHHGDDMFPAAQRMMGPPSDLSAYIAVGAAYGWWVHEGTEHSRANPFLVSSMRKRQGYFNSEMRKAITESVKGSGWR
jgi:hypothetical protein